MPICYIWRRYRKGEKKGEEKIRNEREG